MVSLFLSRFAIPECQSLICTTFVFLYFSLSSVCRGAETATLVTKKLTLDIAAH